MGFAGISGNSNAPTSANGSGFNNIGANCTSQASLRISESAERVFASVAGITRAKSRHTVQVFKIS
jgi:hypothetical protein